MNDELVEYLLKQFEEKLEQHSRRIDYIENKQAETNIRIDNLCSNIEGLTSSIKWLIAISISTLLGFFIWVIQSNIIK